MPQDLARLSTSAGRLRGAFALVTLLLAGCGGGGGAPPAAGSSVVSPGLAVAIYQQANEARWDAGLDPLRWHDRAAGVAVTHAQGMRIRRALVHADAEGRDAGQRLEAAGIRPLAWGENLAHGSGDPAAIVAGWLASPTHRANLLEPRFTHMAVGTAGGGTDVWSTQVFLTLPENLP